MKISEIITDKYKLRIPPTVYYDLLADVQEAEEELMVAIDNSILLPDNATNGDVIKVLFAEYPVLNTLDGFTRMIDPIHNLYVTGRFCNDWWNSPYRENKE